jgi:hypothetical protein
MTGQLWRRILAAGLLAWELAGCAPDTPAALPTAQISATAAPSTVPVPSPTAADHTLDIHPLTAMPLIPTPMEAL